MRYLIIFSFSLYFSSLSFASESTIDTISLKSYYIPKLLESESSGTMIELLQAIEGIAPIKFNLELLPTKRVQASFKHQKIAGYFPELEEFRDASSSCRTSAFMSKNIIAFSHKNDQLITNIKQLENRTVGAVNGYSYGTEITHNPKIKIAYTANDDINIQKLISKRINAIIGDAISTVNAAKKAGVTDELRFDTQFPISQLDVFFVFQNDKQGKNRCQIISKAIDQLKSDGTLYTLFGYQ